MTVQHWSPPDIRGDILAAALRTDAAEPVAVHVRPEVQARMGPGPLALEPTAGNPSGAVGLPASIPVVVDDRLPRTPGYEVHRVAPPAPGGPGADLRLPEDGPSTTEPGPSVATPCAVRSWTGETQRGSRARPARWLRVHHPGHHSA
jgi:hypothetical protein